MRSLMDWALLSACLAASSLSLASSRARSTSRETWVAGWAAEALGVEGADDDGDSEEAVIGARDKDGVGRRERGEEEGGAFFSLVFADGAAEASAASDAGAEEEEEEAVPEKRASACSSSWSCFVAVSMLRCRSLCSWMAKLKRSRCRCQRVSMSLRAASRAAASAVLPASFKSRISRRTFSRSASTS